MASVVAEPTSWANVRKGKYDWDQWLDGQTWRLVGGEDFKVEPGTMRTIATSAAKARGLELKHKITEGDLIIRAVQPSPTSMPTFGE